MANNFKNFLIPVPQVKGLWVEVSLEEGVSGEEQPHGTVSWLQAPETGDTETLLRTYLHPETVELLKRKFEVK